MVDSTVSARVVVDARALSSIALPESTFKNIAASTGIADQQTKLFESIRPALETQTAWLTQMDFINSDIFKTYTANQAMFAELSTILAKTIDFGVFAEIGQKFAEQQTAWLKATIPPLDWWQEAFYPPNLHPIKDLEIEDVEKVVMVDGVALYGVPCTAVSRALIRAGSVAKRREILGRRWESIANDCREALRQCESRSVATYAPYGIAAIDALENGHAEAAQALAGSLTDTLLTSYFGQNRYLYTPDKKGKRTTDAYDEFSVREFIAFAPMWQAYQQFWVSEGDAVPSTFNRHATAHAVGRRQFSRRNAVQALLFATSLIYFLNEQDSKP